MKRLTLGLLLLLLTALPSLAHDPRYSSIILHLETNQLRISLVAPVGKEVGLRQRLVLEADGKPVVTEGESLLPDPSNRTVLLDTYAAVARPRQLSVGKRLFPEDPQSRTIVMLYSRGSLVREEVLDAAHPSFTWTDQQAPESALSVARRFVVEGVSHIFSGPDHVLFIVGLLLLGGSLRQLVKIATAFTLAHSVTLCLAATKTVTLSPSIVEPLIALSIVAVGVDNLLTKPGERDVRAWMALGFGLIHGFGFASALAEVGLPKQALGLSLGAFNVGVELGQLAIVLAVAPALALLNRKAPRAGRRAVLAGTVTVILLGALWFLQRI
ncbi:HupE/UreJ family protein [Armatimonas rosea]|uniref:Hydrogenase/urease accessory protein HupE n=1 Tax=Armatimonas rosea TaxID=685828 RepID=A0A7W9SMC7_ARMRO|nr:HupE/UreJ family protein [Armatimonas rosea]MBB6048578.1 hydrogenase/urease accessory protein HupE [Armatimonas rosea]